jgi:hypothetical protein
MSTDNPTKLDLALQAADAYMNRAAGEEKVQKFNALFATLVVTLYRVSVQRGRLDVDQVLDVVTAVACCDHAVMDLILEALKEEAGESSQWVDQSALVN